MTYIGKKVEHSFARIQPTLEVAMCMYKRYIAVVEED